MLNPAQRVSILTATHAVELDEQHVEHARKQLEEAKARVQAQRAEQQAKKREAAAAAGEKEDAPRRERKPRPTTPRRKEGAERKPRAQKPVEKAPKTVKAPREEQHTPVSEHFSSDCRTSPEGESGSKRDGCHRIRNHQRRRPRPAEFGYVFDCARRTPGVLKRRPGQA